MLYIFEISGISLELTNCAQKQRLTSDKYGMSGDADTRMIERERRTNTIYEKGKKKFYIQRCNCFIFFISREIFLMIFFLLFRNESICIALLRPGIFGW